MLRTERCPTRKQDEKLVLFDQLGLRATHLQLTTGSSNV